MAKKDKQADAKIVKEGPEVLTTKDEGVIPNNDENPKDPSEINYDEQDGPPKDDDEAGKAIDPAKVKSKDEEINAIGADVPTVPKPETKPKAKPKAEITELTPAQFQAAIVYLVKSLMTPADLEDFKMLFPGFM